MKAIVISAVSALAVFAQERYYPTAKDAINCPRLKAVDEDVEGGSSFRRDGSRAAALSASPKTLNEQIIDFPVDGHPALIPEARRKTAAQFKAVDREGKTISVADHTGKVVVIGLWSTTCQASGIQLMELADLQGKGAKYGFEIWPVNYDFDHRTARMTTYLQANGSGLGSTRLLTPGLGDAGVGGLAPMVPALPAIFVLDRQGRIAVQYAGYQPGALMQALKMVMMEPQAKPVSTGPASGN